MSRPPLSPEIRHGTPSVHFSGSSVQKEKTSMAIEEQLDDSPRIIQKIGAELIGTFFLVFVGCGSGFVAQAGNITLVGVAATWSLVLMAMIYSVGHISGAHFNPAVTVAFAVVGQFPWKQVPYYVVSQIIAAIIASVSLQGLFTSGEEEAKVMLTLPGHTVNDLNVIAWEIVASFILMWVICGAAADHRAVKELAGVAIGAALFVDVIVAGTVSGASMNPARSIGPAMATRHFDKIWIYIVAPVFGTTSAALLYNLLQLPRLPNPSKEPEKSKKSIELA